MFWRNVKSIVIGDFRVAFRLCFEATPSASPNEELYIENSFIYR